MTIHYLCPQCGALSEKVGLCPDCKRADNHAHVRHRTRERPTPLGHTPRQIGDAVDGDRRTQGQNQPGNEQVVLEAQVVRPDVGVRDEDAGAHQAERRPFPDQDDQADETGDGHDQRGSLHQQLPERIQRSHERGGAAH